MQRKSLAFMGHPNYEISETGILFNPRGSDLS